MLGSTLLSAATALFFLPAVFSAPIAPATSVSVSDVSTTISTTKGAALQKVQAVFEEKKSDLDTVWENMMKVPTSEFNLDVANDVFGHVIDILYEVKTGVQSASTTAADSVAVNVDLVGVATAVALLLEVVFKIIFCVLSAVTDIKEAVIPLVQNICVAVLAVLNVVVSLVPEILAIVVTILVKVDGLVGMIKNLVALNIFGITKMVDYLGLQAAL